MITTVGKMSVPAAEQAPVSTAPGVAATHLASVTPTQVRRPWRSTGRTVFQAFVMLCAIAPAIYSAATQNSPELATGYAAAGLAIAGAVTRIMAIPRVEKFLRRFLPFLAAAPNPDGSRRSDRGAVAAMTVLAIAVLLLVILMLVSLLPVR